MQQVHIRAAVRGVHAAGGGGGESAAAAEASCLPARHAARLPGLVETPHSRHRHCLTPCDQRPTERLAMLSGLPRPSVSRACAASGMSCSWVLRPAACSSTGPGGGLRVRQPSGAARLRRHRAAAGAARKHAAGGRAAAAAAVCRLPEAARGARVRLAAAAERHVAARMATVHKGPAARTLQPCLRCTDTAAAVMAPRWLVPGGAPLVISSRRFEGLQVSSQCRRQSRQACWLNRWAMGDCEVAAPRAACDRPCL
jgi:hypothetical protein